MDGHRADDAGDVVIAHQDALGDQHAGVDAASLVDLQEAAVGVAGDDQADLVHMGADHHTLAGRGAVAFLDDDHIAHLVDVGGVALRLQLLQERTADGLLMARRGVDFSQCLQIHRSSSQLASSSLIK